MATKKRKKKQRVKRFKTLALGKLKSISSGAYGEYYRVSRHVGVKVLHDDSEFSSREDAIDKLRYSSTKDEFDTLKEAYKKLKGNKCIPKPISLVLIEVGENSYGEKTYGIGFTLQHIVGKTLCEKNVTHATKEKIVNKLYGTLAQNGIFHRDLHDENIIISNKKAYALDFGDEFVDFNYTSIKSGGW